MRRYSGQGCESSSICFTQVTPEQAAASVAKVVADEQDVLKERRYLFNQNILVGKVLHRMSACWYVASVP